MIEKIKEIRVQLDGLTQLTENLKPFESLSKEQLMLLDVNRFQRSNQIIEVIKALQLSKMWLGKVLKELGTANPYPESKNPIKYRTTQIMVSTHGEIPIGTESVKVEGNEVTFNLSGVNVIFDIKNNSYWLEIIPNEKIEPTADTNSGARRYVSGESSDIEIYMENGSKNRWNSLNHIQKVKWLRAEIEKVETEIKKLQLDLKIHFTVESVNYKDSWINQYVINSMNYCIEAGMWLGMELSRIRDLENK